LRTVIFPVDAFTAEPFEGNPAAGVRVRGGRIPLESCAVVVLCGELL
jgi:secondary thiamine-phosphate synthase enzyme